MTERQYWIAFNLAKGIGPVRTRRLLARFGTLREAWHASIDDLAQAGLDRRTLDTLRETRQTLDPAAEMARLDKLGIAVLTWQDEDYPLLLAELRSIDQAPPVLYLHGSLDARDQWSLAVVGTRSASAYGRQVGHRLSRELSANGLTIISGLARGLDAEAHRAALDAGGRTIAILPCGLDMVYPPEHRQLAAQIVQQGALMSPFPLGTQPEGKNFAWRNSVMSGLARGVLVIEAGLKSGALMTAGHALEQGREVFAVPGNITAQGSSGTNRLIQEGAHPVIETSDILEVLNLDEVAQYVEAQAALPQMSGDEQRVLEELSPQPTHVDELAHKVGLPVQAVNGVLTLLELKGVARQVAPMTYVRS